MGGDGKTDTVDDCPDDVKSAWEADHIKVNPKTDWQGVDADLRDAVVRTSMDLRKDFYISAGKETGKPHTATTTHGSGRGVDVSRVNGTRFLSMNRTTARLLGNQVAAGIVNRLPYGRCKEVFSPGMAFRCDMMLSQPSRNRLMQKHQDHVHISIEKEK